MFGPELDVVVVVVGLASVLVELGVARGIHCRIAGRRVLRYHEIIDVLEECARFREVGPMTVELENGAGSRR